MRSTAASLLLSIAACATTPSDDVVDLGTLGDDGKADATLLERDIELAERWSETDPRHAYFYVHSAKEFDVSLSYDGDQQARIRISRQGSESMVVSAITARPSVTVPVTDGNMTEFSIDIQNHTREPLRAHLQIVARGETKSVELRRYTWTIDVSTYQVLAGCTHAGMGSRLFESTYTVDLQRVTTTTGPRWLERERTFENTTERRLAQWFNHGRTVNYNPGCFTQTTALEFAEQPETLEEDRDKARRVAECIAKIKDGPCDSYGSCKYCLPYNANGSCYEPPNGYTSNAQHGHNSNNDADALFRMISDCRNTIIYGSAPETSEISRICAVGSTVNAAACKSSFVQTPVVSASCGGASSGPQPLCSTNGLPVFGGG